MIAPSLGARNFYDDTRLSAGVAWEYRVRRLQRDIFDQGYYALGTALPAQDQRGLVLFVTEDGLAEDIRPELDRFAKDLTGDGWHVLQLTGPSARGLDAEAELVAAWSLRADLMSQFAAGGAEDTEVAVVLVGDVPLVKSGWVAPDGHAPQATASDLFYGDFDGDWPQSDSTPGTLQPSRLPGNGIEASVGRIDFSDLATADRAQEIAYLTDYFDRNHAWRHGQWGDLREAYLGAKGHLFVEGDGLANIVGPAAITPGGHHDVGESGRWLFEVDFGDFNGATYLTEYAAKPVFAINFDSNKQKIDQRNNPMTTMMAASNQALAVDWGARPAWRLHAMALGRTIGDAQRRTANNQTLTDGLADYMPTGKHRLMAPIWLNLMGDPTLHAFPVLPAADLKAVPQNHGMTLTWQASPDARLQGYRLYRAGRDGMYHPIGPDLIAAEQFTDPAPTPDARYMLRALAFKEVHAGTLLMLSQGVFSESP